MLEGRRDLYRRDGKLSPEFMSALAYAGEEAAFFCDVEFEVRSDDVAEGLTGTKRTKLKYASETFGMKTILVCVFSRDTLAALARRPLVYPLFV